MTDLYGSPDVTTQVALGVVMLSFLWAMVRAMFRVIGNRGKNRA